MKFNARVAAFLSSVVASSGAAQLRRGTDKGQDQENAIISNVVEHQQEQQHVNGEERSEKAASRLFTGFSNPEWQAVHPDGPNTNDKHDHSSRNLYPVFAQQDYSNPRAANGKLACANCHLNQKAIEIEAPQAVLPNGAIQSTEVTKSLTSVGPGFDCAVDTSIAGMPSRAFPDISCAFGKPAGQDPNFSYSPGLMKQREKGLKWDEKTLEQFLKHPDKFNFHPEGAFLGIKDHDTIDSYIKWMKESSCTR